MSEMDPRFRRRSTLYSAAIGAAGAALLAWLLYDLPREADLRSGAPGIVFFLLLTIAAASSPIRLPRGGLATVAFAVDFATLLIFGPAVAAAIGAVSAVILLRRSTLSRVVFNAGQLVLALGLAGLAYQWAGGRFVWLAQPERVEFHRSLAALLLGGSVYVLVNTVAVTAMGVLVDPRCRFLGIWLVGFRWLAPQFVALAPFGVLMAMVYQVPQLKVLAVTLFLLPLFLARYAFKGGMDLLQVHRDTIAALSNALEAYDAYTRNHSERVTRYVEMIAREMRLAEPRIEALIFAARLHDLGKCQREWDDIISKPGRPDDRQWEIIRRHPADSSRIAEELDFVTRSAPIVRAHHERLDGTGYPNGLKGEEISLAARILCVADAFEAMTSRRAYQRSRSVGEALAELSRCAGTQFDPQVVAAFAALHARGVPIIPEEEGLLEQAPAAASAGHVAAA